MLFRSAGDELCALRADGPAVALAGDALVRAHHGEDGGDGGAAGDGVGERIGQRDVEQVQLDGGDLHGVPVRA